MQKRRSPHVKRLVSIVLISLFLFVDFAFAHLPLSKNATINIIGSNIAGKGGTQLAADGDIKLLAAHQVSRERSKNKSSGWNAGVALDFSNGVSIGVTAGGNYGKGHGNGDSTVYRHSHVGDENSQTNIVAGKTLTLKGGQAIGKGVQVKAQNLNIESVQDSATYDGKQMNVSAQVTVGYGASGSASFSQSKVNADHLAVSEQSGILAGDDGFQINIKNHTDLTGGIITSTEKAEADNKNAFSTGTISTSALANHSYYDADGFGIGGGLSISGKSLGQGEHSKDSSLINIGGASSGTSKSVGYGSDSDSQNSITYAGIGTSNITITDTAKQQSIQPDALNTESLKTTLSTDEVLAARGLQNRFDKAAVQKEIDLQVAVTKKFGTIAPQVVASYAQSKTEKYRNAELKEKSIQGKLDKTTDPEKRAELQTQLNDAIATKQSEQATYDRWKEGGSARVILHTAIGGLLTGDVSGALGAGSTAALAPQISKVKASLPEGLQGAFDLVAGAAIGAVAGGEAGAFTGTTIDWNNRQLHQAEIDLIKANAKKFAKQQGISEEEAESILAAETLRGVSDDFAILKENKAARDFLNGLNVAGTQQDGQTLFGVLDRKSDEYRNSSINISTLPSNLGLYNRVDLAKRDNFSNVLSILKSAQTDLISYPSHERALEAAQAMIDTAEAYNRLANYIKNNKDKFEDKFGINSVKELSQLLDKAKYESAEEFKASLDKKITNKKDSEQFYAILQDFRNESQNIRGELIDIRPSLPKVPLLSSKDGVLHNVKHLLTAISLGYDIDKPYDDPVNQATLDTAIAVEQMAGYAMGGKGLSGSFKGKTIELFTDKSGPLVKGAYGVSPVDPKAIAKDARSMPNIATGSQARVIANNPYIPKDAGGKFTIMDYLPEASRITKKGGEIVINGTKSNKYIRGIPNEAELQKMGLKLKYNGELKPEFKDMPFKTTDGRALKNRDMKTIIFEKVK